MGENKRYICCICGKEFTGWGNNPDPVLDEDGNPFFDTAKCCDECNDTIVIPTRIMEIFKGE